MISRANFFKEEKWYPTLLFCVQRCLYSILGWALFTLGYVPLTEHPIYRPYFGILPITDGISGAFLGVWQRFDVIHFLRIAQAGYTDADLSPFFPLFPLLSRFFGKLLGGNYLLGAFIISNIACLIAINVLYFWVLEEGYDRPHAKRTILFLLCFPTSFFLFVPYSESLFLLFCVLAMWSIRRGKWVLAGTASLLATLTRIGGIVLSVVMLTEWFMRRKATSRRESVIVWLSSALPFIAYAILALWRSKQNLPGLVQVQATYWYRQPALPWEGIVLTISRLLQQLALSIEVLDLLVVLGMLLVGFFVLRMLPASLAVFHWGLLILSLSQIRLGQPLSGQARYAIILFPAFIVLAKFARGPIAKRGMAYTFLILNLFLAGQFVLWGWVG
ncbi:MAG: hypothetical protein E4G99_07300 [Anaerolineales bacterium]|nr:MAG: hypothetical protein E4G99_07300 [Anaerolineales bacterium]